LYHERISLRRQPLSGREFGFLRSKLPLRKSEDGQPREIDQRFLGDTVIS